MSLYKGKLFAGKEYLGKLYSTGSGTTEDGRSQKSRIAFIAYRAPYGMLVARDRKR
jgi:hypothetical protein